MPAVSPGLKNMTMKKKGTEKRAQRRESKRKKPKKKRHKSRVKARTKRRSASLKYDIAIQEENGKKQKTPYGAKRPKKTQGFGTLKGRASM